MTTRKEIRSLTLSFLTTIALLAGIGIRVLDTLPPDILRSITSESDDSKMESSATNAPAKPLTFAKLATQQEIPSGNWFYGGSTTWAAIRDLTDSRINESIPDFRITYIQDPVEPPGSGNGIEMLIKGKTSFAHSSRPIRDEELDAAAQRGIQPDCLTHL